MHITILLAAVGVVNGQVSSANESNPPDHEYCVISLIDHAQLSAQETGILVVLTAKEGDIVEADQVLGKIDDTDAQARKTAAVNRLAVAHEKATNDAEVQVAEKIIELAEAEYNESVEINKRSRDSIPQATVRRQFVQWQKAVQDKVVAEMNFTIAGFDEKVAEAERDMIQNELNRRTIRAPFKGVVVQLFRQQSEWVKPGDPILRIVNMDRLRVEGFLQADKYAPGEVDGAKVTITVDLAGEEQGPRGFSSTISHVSALVEASGGYRVWAEVDNPSRGGYWMLLPGTEAQMVIQRKRLP